MIDPGRQGRFLAEIAGQGDAADIAVQARQDRQYVGGTVRAAIVDEQIFSSRPRPDQRQRIGKRRTRRIQKQRQAVLLVENGNDDRHGSHGAWISCQTLMLAIGQNG